MPTQTIATLPASAKIAPPATMTAMGASTAPMMVAERKPPKKPTNDCSAVKPASR